MFLIGLALSQAAAACQALDEALPAPLAAWSTARHGSPADLTKPVVFASRDPKELGSTQQEASSPESIFDWTERLRAEKPVQTGGATSVGVKIDRAGVYGIVLDQEAEVQVSMKGGKPLIPFSTEGGPSCSSIARVERFELVAGRYELRLSDLEKPSVKVMLLEFNSSAVAPG